MMPCKCASTRIRRQIFFFYKIVGTVKNRWKTAWTDKKIKSGKTYYYRVAAYKKLKKKIVQRKSAWAMVSTKAAKVNSVKLSIS